VYGGKGANQAVAAARLGSAVTFVGSVGKDQYGDQIRLNLVSDGIDVRYLSIADGHATGAAGIVVDSSGNNYIAVASGANHAVSPAQIDNARSVIESANVVLLQMEISAPANRRVVEIASGANVPVILNFAPARIGEFEIDGRIAGLIVNETEAAEISGMVCQTVADAYNVASHLLSMVGSFVVVTLGKAGAVLADGSGAAHVPAYEIVPVDATAAGDVFCGCLAVEIARGSDLRNSCNFANAAAALSVTRPGAQPSIPTRQALEEFLRTAHA